jgi:predicted transcriptional regulator
MKKPQEIIKELIKMGFSQREISEHTQVPSSTICRILKGKHTNPRWRTVESLNYFLDTVGKFDDENI